MDKFERLMVRNIKTWSKGKKSPPILATFRLTNLCDLNCVFCGEKDKPAKDELEIKDYKRIFKELSKLGIKLCALVGGGEVLCKKELTFKVLKLIQKYNMKGWIVTNGFNLNKEDIKKIISYNTDTVLFSLDAASPELHDRLRGRKGSFQKVIENIQLFDYWKKRLNKKKPELKIQMLVLNQNYKNIRQMIRLSKSLGIQELIINYLITLKTLSQNLKLSKKQIRELEKDLKQMLSSNKKYERISNFKNFLKILFIKNKRAYFKKPARPNVMCSYCFQPWLHLNISENGYVNYCPEINNLFKLENVNEKNIKSIWYGKNFNMFRERILNGQLIIMCNKSCALPIVNDNLNVQRLIRKTR